MKALLIAVFLSVPQTLTPIPRQAPDDTASRRQAVQENPANHQKPPTAQPLQTAEGAKNDQNTGNEPPKTNTQQTIVIRESVPVSVGKDWWDKGYILLTGLLVGIGALTFGAIWYQARKTAQATEAMRDSTELQKIGMRQWVITGNWRQEPRYVNGLLAEIILYIPILNETDYPLTMESVVAEINGIEEIKTVRSQIAPRGKEPHTVSFRIRAESIDIQKYYQNQFILVVGCTVTFIGVLNDKQAMTFNRYYRCGPQEFEQKDQYTQSRT